MPLSVPDAHRAFVLAQTTVLAPPLLPELLLHLATEVTPLWHATEKSLAEAGVEPPFWAFAWAGGQGLARHLLDHPALVRGRRVLDFASGSGLVALAAARAGAAHVVALDRDPLAAAAAALNAERLGLAIEPRLADVLDDDAALDEGFDVVTAGDVCYDAAWAGRAVSYLRRHARAGALVLLGDPGRSYLPVEGLEEIARYPVRTIDDIEGRRELTGVVYRVRA